MCRHHGNELYEGGANHYHLPENYSIGNAEKYDIGREHVGGHSGLERMSYEH